jgi:xanthine dehydrogenase YagT iron-sulfur-binding subunit
VTSTDVAAPVTEGGPEAGTTVLTVNGQAHALRIEPRVSLLDALREHAGLTGSKKGCDQGTCGACTVCTPGQIMSAVKLLEEGHAGNDAEIAEWMSGNICRCAAYPNIRAAIRQVRDAAGVNGDAAVSG